MPFRLDKIYGFIRIHDKLDIQYYLFIVIVIKVMVRLKYLLSKKIGITDSVSHNFVRIRIESYDSLPTKKILTFHNVIVLFKSGFKMKYCYKYYFYILLERGSYKDKSHTRYFKTNVCIL